MQAWRNVPTGLWGESHHDFANLSTRQLHKLPKILLLLFHNRLKQKRWGEKRKRKKKNSAWIFLYIFSPNNILIVFVLVSNFIPYVIKFCLKVQFVTYNYNLNFTLKLYFVILLYNGISGFCLHFYNLEISPATSYNSSSALTLYLETQCLCNFRVWCPLHGKLLRLL